MDVTALDAVRHPVPTAREGVFCLFSATALSGVRVTIDVVEVSAQMVAKIPRGNIRVSRDEFCALWRAAEAFHDERVRNRVGDWYGAGVVMTCRWLARATVRPPEGRPYMAFSPVTERDALAMEELIQAELLAAEKLAIRSPGWLAERPGWLDAVIATLNWAWLRRGEPPVPFEHRTAAAG